MTGLPVVPSSVAISDVESRDRWLALRLWIRDDPLAGGNGDALSQADERLDLGERWSDRYAAAAAECPETLESPTDYRPRDMNVRAEATIRVLEQVLAEAGIPPEAIRSKFPDACVHKVNPPKVMGPGNRRRPAILIRFDASVKDPAARVKEIERRIRRAVGRGRARQFEVRVQNACCRTSCPGCAGGSAVPVETKERWLGTDRLPERVPPSDAAWQSEDLVRAKLLTALRTIGGEHADLPSLGAPDAALLQEFEARLSDGLAALDLSRALEHVVRPVIGARVVRAMPVDRPEVARAVRRRLDDWLAGVSDKPTALIELLPGSLQRALSGDKVADVDGLAEMSTDLVMAKIEPEGGYRANLSKDAQRALWIGHIGGASATIDAFADFFACADLRAIEDRLGLYETAAAKVFGTTIGPDVAALRAAIEAAWAEVSGTGSFDRTPLEDAARDAGRRFLERVFDSVGSSSSIGDDLLDPMAVALDRLIGRPAAEDRDRALAERVVDLTAGLRASSNGA